MKESLPLFILCCLPLCCQAEEASLVLESRITGNQEQPKVLYLVPWQSGTGAEQLNLPLDSPDEPLFEPVRRDEFLRQLAFRRQWQQAKDEPSGQ